MNSRTLPLGIDIGSTRIRIVEAEQHAEGTRVRAVAVRDVSSGNASSGALQNAEYVSALLEEALAELGTRQRKCVCAIGSPEASLRSLSFPKMTTLERERAARFEAQRHIDYDVQDAIIKVHPVDRDSGVWALGIARSSAVLTRLAALRGAGLRVVAMDHESLALTRVLPAFDAVIDIGHQRTSMHVRGAHTPSTLQTNNGGADVTRGIQKDLSLDPATAEKRKRMFGTAGAGERARSSLMSDIAALIRRARGTRTIGRVAIVGNAARLAGTVSELETVTGALCEVPVSAALQGPYYPEDVIRSSAPDWTLAAGLALWSVA